MKGGQDIRVHCLPSKSLRSTNKTEPLQSTKTPII